MPNAHQSEGEVKIKRARYDSLCLYEVTETELEILERGSPCSIYFNFSIFLLSVAISFTVALLTVKIESVKLFAFFLVVTIVGYLGGIFLLILWFRNRKSIKSIIKKIKDRLPPEDTPKDNKNNNPQRQREAS